MSTRIGINGFGRMGRLVLRAAWGWPDLDFVHINEIEGGPTAGAHLLEFDSVHGRYPHRIEAQENAISIDGRRIGWTEHAAPGDVPWKELGADIVLNCLAPVVKVLHEGIGIRHGVITTIHDITNTQTIVDAPHEDLRRARANSLSLIPTSTGSATAIGLIYPELLGKLNGIAVRVPLLNASLTDCVFEVARPTTVHEINGLFQRAAAEGPLRGILGYEERPLVSIDFKDDPRSAIVDALSTMVVEGTSVKVLAWYDNEIGYVHRMAELARIVGRSMA
jgi:glyceraldehyde 3-phosphate dehydrogenase